MFGNVIERKQGVNKTRKETSKDLMEKCRQKWWRETRSSGQGAMRKNLSMKYFGGKEKICDSDQGMRYTTTRSNRIRKYWGEEATCMQDTKRHLVKCLQTTVKIRTI